MFQSMLPYSINQKKVSPQKLQTQFNAEELILASPAYILYVFITYRLLSSQHFPNILYYKLITAQRYATVIVAW